MMIIIVIIIFINVEPKKLSGAIHVSLGGSSSEEKVEAENGVGSLEQGRLQQEQSSRRVATMVMGRRRVTVPGCTESPAPMGDVVLAELL